MTLEEYQKLNKPCSPKKPEIGVFGSDTRTLLFGYDCDSLTYHVYQHENEIHCVIYKGDYKTGGALYVESHIKSDKLPIERLIPNKRVYPALSDYEFCDRIESMGFSIPFTNFDPDRTLESRGGIAGFTNIPEIDNLEMPVPGTAARI